MRSICRTVLLAVILVCIPSGCITGSGRGSDVIDAVVPDPHQMVTCADEGIDGPPGRTCTMAVGGVQRDVVHRLVTALADRGFEVACTTGSQINGGTSVTVNASRPDLRVTASVYSTGMVGDKPIPFGFVGLNIDASEYKDSVPFGDACEA